MLIFYILLFISILLFCIPFFIEDTWYLTLFSIILLIFNLTIGLGAIRSSSNPEVKKYNELLELYNYTTSHDSIPFKMKTDLYDDCSEFNRILSDYDEYHNSNWVGVYYPEIGNKRNKMKTFDISKIK